MRVIGITGPSGAGKGVISKILNEYGVHTIDADQIYHQIITPPSQCLDELALKFGDEIINSDGRLNRNALSRLVFGEENKDKLLILNSITHSYVINDIKDILSDMNKNNISVCAIDAPLLIESGLNKICDFTISVLANKDTRISRISVRDSISEQMANLRISSQKNDDFYIYNSNYTIYNNGEISDVQYSVINILKERNVIKYDVT